jgi:UDP:flavonoid glycosyltransferase YjiC (YdhE family)
MMRRLLFISDSFGLGHIVRDLQIADELRRQIPATRISWLAGEPARTFLIERGEEAHPAINRWADETDILEQISNGTTYHANVMSFLVKCRKAWKNNVEVFEAIMNTEEYDLVVGDETYELTLALSKRIRITPTFVMMFDFIGVDVVSNNPLDRLIAYKWNYEWAKINRTVPRKVLTSIFIGEMEDVPDKSFGFLLPNRRESVKNRNGNFVGYIVQFNPKDYANKQEIRKKLGLGNEPLIVCSVGGTSIGLPLLELCCRTFPLIKGKIPSATMVLFPGPRISREHFSPTEGITVKEHLSNLYEYFAACDLAIVQAGSSTTLELVALNKPFVYFPIEGHFEQQVHVAARLERLHAGVKMQFSQTTPAMLAEQAVSQIGSNVNYPPIRLDGAKNTVNVLRHLMKC